MLTTVQMKYQTLSNPLLPPCSVFGPSLTGRVYSFPSRQNFPFPIRFATLPRDAPKYVLLEVYPEQKQTSVSNTINRYYMFSRPPQFRVGSECFTRKFLDLKRIKQKSEISSYILRAKIMV